MTVGPTLVCTACRMQGFIPWSVKLILSDFCVGKGAGFNCNLFNLQGSMGLKYRSIVSLRSVFVMLCVTIFVFKQNHKKMNKKRKLVILLEYHERCFFLSNSTQKVKFVSWIHSFHTD